MRRLYLKSDSNIAKKRVVFRCYCKQVRKTTRFFMLKLYDPVVNKTLTESYLYLSLELEVVEGIGEVAGLAVFIIGLTVLVEVALLTGLTALGSHSRF